LTSRRLPLRQRARVSPTRRVFVDATSDNTVEICGGLNLSRFARVKCRQFQRGRMPYLLYYWTRILTTPRVAEALRAQREAVRVMRRRVGGQRRRIDRLFFPSREPGALSSRQDCPRQHRVPPAGHIRVLDRIVFHLAGRVELIGRQRAGFGILGDILKATALFWSPCHFVRPQACTGESLWTPNGKRPSPTKDAPGT